MVFLAVRGDFWISGLGSVEDILTPAPATPASVPVSVGTSEQLNVDIVVYSLPDSTEIKIESQEFQRKDRRKE